jgi:hypothetical protein
VNSGKQKGKRVDSVATVAIQTPMQPARLRTLQALGVLCGFAAGAWLGEPRRRSKWLAGEFLQ